MINRKNSSPIPISTHTPNKTMMLSKVMPSHDQFAHPKIQHIPKEATIFNHMYLTTIKKRDETICGTGTIKKWCASSPKAHQLWRPKSNRRAPLHQYLAEAVRVPGAISFTAGFVTRKTLHTLHSWRENDTRITGDKSEIWVLSCWLAPFKSPLNPRFIKQKSSVGSLFSGYTLSRLAQRGWPIQLSSKCEVGSDDQRGHNLRGTKKSAFFGVLVAS